MSRSAVAYPDFLKVWLGTFVSRIGTEMTFGIAIPYEVFKLSKGDALALGFIGLARGVPIILSALAGGYLADAFDRRRLLMMTQVLFCALSTLLAFAAFGGFTSVPLLYGVTVLGGVLVAIDLPARQALLPNLVSPEAFPQAVSLNATTFQLAAVLGPALGGLILGWKGTPTIYAIDAATFLVLFAGIALVRYRRPETAPRASIEGVLDGVRFVWKQPVLWSTMTLDFLATFLAGCMFLMPKFVFESLDSGSFVVPVLDKHLTNEQALGVILAAPALGAALTAAFLSRLPPIKKQGIAILAGVAIYGVTSAAFGVATNLWIAFVLLALSGAGDAVSMIVRNTLRQELTPDALRARMVSFNMIFFVGGPLLGEYEAGVVARIKGDPGGVPFSIVLGGVLCVVIAVLYAVRYPWLARYERQESPTS